MKKDLETKNLPDNKRGITLIALIITIIVLLILAGVTISMVVGDNGVLKQAQNAKIKTEKAKDEELRGLTAAEAGGNLEMTWYQDGENKVPIPAGFAVSQVEGENTIDDGLVVIDSNGNEFVWIPCGDPVTSPSEDGKNYSPDKYVNAEYYSRKNGEGNSNSKGWSSYAYENDVKGQTENEYKGKTGWTNPTDQTTAAKASIEKYGGFYVARFEAGVPSNASFYVSTNGSSNGEEYKGKNGTSGTSPDSNGFTTTRYDRKDENLKPVSKRYNQVWNYIDQKTAKEVSKKMYEDNDDVDSYLIDSNAWNYICGDIFGDEKRLGQDGIKKSTEYGNYLDNKTTDYASLECLWANHKVENNAWKYATKYGKGSITSDVISGRSNGNRLELATGASDDFKVYNIYDMAGNVWEWTAETATNGSSCYVTDRGGGFNLHPVGSSVVCADGGNNSEFTSPGVGFRSVLYVE